jgi:methylmalonyl-CoA/ethylmalonyl-CoA epimerase
MGIDLSAANRWGLTFHHLGLAVRDPEPAKTFLSGLGYEIGEIIFDPLQNVNLGMCVHEHMPDVEIIYPAKGTGPLDSMLGKHRNGLVYHMCFVSKDLEKSIEAIEADDAVRLMTVSLPKEAVLFNGKKVSFYIVADVGLIEIIDEAEAA